MSDEPDALERWYFPLPVLEPGERIVYSTRTHRVLAWGEDTHYGTLVITDEHFLFQPNRLDLFFRLRPSAWPRSDFLGADIPAGRRTGAVGKRVTNGGTIRDRVHVFFEHDAVIVLVHDSRSLVEALETPA